MIKAVIKDTEKILKNDVWLYGGTTVDLSEKEYEEHKEKVIRINVEFKQKEKAFKREEK